MITFSDSFIGTNTELVGTPIEACSAPCNVWTTGDTSGLYRNTTALQAAIGSYAAAANLLDPVLELPSRLVVEAELYTLDSGSNNQSNSASLVIRGTIGGADSSVIARISAQRTPSSLRAVYSLDVPVIGELTLYTDNTYYTDFVKRRIDVDLVNKTYACYAGGALINSGTFAEDPSLDSVTSMGASVFMQRGGSTASASRIKNFYAEMYVGPPVPPVVSLFWTDLVNTYEVP